MLNKLQKRQTEKGFTIIEVMIVLAIAALIMLIVFLAVPALQRSARNTQRNSDASRVSSAIADFVSNNNGTLPAISSSTTPSWNTDCGTITDDAGKLGEISATLGCAAATTANPTTGSTDKLVESSGAVALTIAPGQGSVDEYVLDEGGVCGSEGTSTAGQARQIALFYTVETGSSDSWKCIQAE